MKATIGLVYGLNTSWPEKARPFTALSSGETTCKCDLPLEAKTRTDALFNLKHENRMKETVTALASVLTVTIKDSGECS